MGRGLRAAGTLVRAGRDGIRESAYWRLEAREHAGDLASTAGTVRELLADIVHRQTVADVPLCSLLSGGLDSSVVSALAADSLSRRDRAKLVTFSVDFTGSADAFTPDQLRPSHDEPFARAAAEYIGSRHSTITLEADDLVTAQWAPLAAHDLPTFGDMYMSFVLLCREISKQSTVALSGEAADEVFGGYPWYHVPALLAAPTFPWAARGSWEPLLRPDVRTRIRLREYAADRYAQALAEVPRLAGESPEDRRIREILYLGLTRWLPFLLDRKDRLSMACGLEVRVPFTDHRLVEYVWNVPWSMKEAGGIEKGLLRAAADGLLPGDLLRRRKSIYPGAADPAYERAIDAQLRRLMTQPDAPLFELISREALTAAYAADPRLPGLMSVQPSSTSPVAFLLDVNRWLERSGVTIRWALPEEGARIEGNPDAGDLPVLHVAPVDDGQRPGRVGPQLEPGEHVRAVHPALDHLDLPGHGEHPGQAARRLRGPVGAAQRPGEVDIRVQQRPHAVDIAVPPGLEVRCRHFFRCGTAFRYSTACRFHGTDTTPAAAHS